MNTANVMLSGALNFSGNSATDAGINTACSTALGAGALDTADVCGVVSSSMIIGGAGGTPQSTPVSTAFANPLVATVTAGGNPVQGVRVVFAGPSSGASISPASTAVTTNASGVASAPVYANAIAGGPYTVTATVDGVATSATYSLTNNVTPVATTLNKTAGDNQGSTALYATNLKVR